MKLSTLLCHYQHLYLWPYLIITQHRTTVMFNLSTNGFLIFGFPDDEQSSSWQRQHQWGNATRGRLEPQQHFLQWSDWTALPGATKMVLVGQPATSNQQTTLQGDDEPDCYGRAVLGVADHVLPNSTFSRRKVSAATCDEIKLASTSSYFTLP